MTLTLSTTLTRVSGLLMDASNDLWPVGDVTNGIRLALYEMSLRAGSALTLNGLDAAAATTVPALLEGALIVGAAGYAAAARQVDKADFEVASESRDLKPWVEARLKEFREMMGQVYTSEAARLSGMRSTATPWAAWTDDFGEADNYSTD